MNSTRLIVIRHGETEWNVVERLQGHSDSPLSPLGAAQVAALGERFHSIPIAALYASDLPRALASAAPIAAVSGRSIVAVPELRERGLGVFEGLTRVEAQERYPDQFRHHRSDRLDFAPTGGETSEQHLARTLDAMRTLAERHVGETIALVTHGGSLSMLFRAVLGIPFNVRRAYFVQNTALNVFDYDVDGLSLVSWGDTGHLASLPSA